MLLQAQQSGLHKFHLSPVIPLLDAIYLTPHTTYAQQDIWGDTLLNKSTYAAEIRKTTLTLLVQEGTKIAN